ncbi:MAG: manganese efflux pump [Phycisphaerae bacterium]|nr:manganese efflux pump [Phycisphaerae bacterium]
MSHIAVIGIAIALAMDAFTVSLAVGMFVRPLTGRHLFRLGWHFGLFQFLMPLVGWLAGVSAQQYIAAYDHWVAAILLGIVGGRMIHAAVRGGEEQLAGDPTRGLTLVVLSVATSIDALAIGITLAALGVGIWYPAVVIGFVAGGLTVAGLLIGARLGRAFRRGMLAVGGLILWGVAAKVLIQHWA